MLHLLEKGVLLLRMQILEVHALPLHLLDVLLLHGHLLAQPFDFRLVAGSCACSNFLKFLLVARGLGLHLAANTLQLEFMLTSKF